MKDRAYCRQVGRALMGTGHGSETGLASNQRCFGREAVGLADWGEGVPCVWI